MFAKAIKACDFDSLVEIFEATGIPFSPINRPAEMYRDPHVMRSGGMHLSQLPDSQTVRAPGLPIEMDGTMPSPAALDVANIGDDTGSILAEIGLSASESTAASGQ